jgi:4-hydroxy-tetrahydrodipicolinate synthase
MSHEKLKKSLVGPCTALATPLNRDLSLDEKGLRANIRFVLDGGFKKGRGWILAATPGGESPFMTMSERKRVMEVFADEVKGKIPLETSVADNSYEAVLDLMRHAKDVGFDAVQVPPPWYHGTSQDEVFRFYQGVTSAVDIPVMIINATWLRILDGTGYQPPLLERLSRLDGIIGVKWSSPDWFNYIRCIREYKHRFLFSDNNFLGLGCLWGCTSFIDVLAQFYPEYPLEHWDILQTKNFESANEHLWKLEIPYYFWLRKMQKEGVHGEGPLVKAALWLTGRPAGPAKPPYDEPFTEVQLEELRQIMLKGGVPGVRTAREALGARLGGP